MQISKDLASYTIAVGTTEATSDEIPYEEWSSGEVFIPTGSTITSLTWYAAYRQRNQPSGTVPSPAPTYLPAQDSAGAAVTQTVAATKCYPIPVALAGCAAIKCVGNAAGTITVCVKG